MNRDSASTSWGKLPAGKHYVDFRWVDIERPRSDIDFSRVKKIGLGVSWIITRWKLGTGESKEYPMTIGFLSEVTRSGNTFTGVQEITGDTVRVTVGPSSIQAEGGNRNELLGSLGNRPTASGRDVYRITRSQF